MSDQQQPVEEKAMPGLTDAQGREIKVGATVRHRELTQKLTWEVSAIVEDEGVIHLLLDQGSRYFGPFSDLELVDSHEALK